MGCFTAWALFMQNSDTAMALKSAQKIMPVADRLVMEFPSLKGDQ